MPHTIEPATTGRSKCRACGEPIPKDELRFGERLPNPFGDDGSETTHWYHVLCGAYRRPESFGEVLKTHAHDLDDYQVLARAVALGLAHRRVERINGVERASTGRARCRHCREAIAKDALRIGLVFFEEGMTNPAGFIHASCAGDYFGTTDILDRLRHFGTGLDEEDFEELAELLTG
jgi:hypothetical protein